MRRALAVLLTVLAAALVWFALTAPDRPSQLTPVAFLRVPLEALVLGALLLLPRWRRATLVVVGLLLGAVALLRVLDLAFYETLDRPFDTVVDWGYLGPLTGLVVDSVGRAAGVGVIGTVVLVVVLLLLALPWALLRLSRLARGHRRAALRVFGAAAALALVTSPLGVVSTSASSYVVDQVRRVPAQVRDEHAFERATRDDPLSAVPPERLLTGLRGKDVLFVFVESYGRVALDASGVRTVLDDGTGTLAADGFSSRSAYLTSPTFGGISWLAHATLQSGLWVDSQRRYDVLLRGDRDTLARTFGRAGWRTVSDVPANTSDWPQGRFYGYDAFYDARNVGYDGPRFGYPTMPDQFTLDAFHRLELASTSRRPVMAEIDLVTSHAPWSRVPPVLDQAAVGDGSVYDGVPERLASKADVWRSPARIRAAYARSVAYSLASLVSFVHAYGDPDLVVVVLGDHQPATVVTGRDATHDVPVSVVAHDPAVTRRFASWGWQPGLRPDGDAPVWRMDRFRDRFLAGFGPH